MHSIIIIAVRASMFIRTDTSNDFSITLTNGDDDDDDDGSDDDDDNSDDENTDNVGC